MGPRSSHDFEMIPCKGRKMQIISDIRFAVSFLMDGVWSLSLVVRLVK